MCDSLLQFPSDHVSVISEAEDSREVKASKRFSSRLGFVQIIPYFPQQGQTGQDSNLLFFFLIESVFLWGDKIEKRLGTVE